MLNLFKNSLLGLGLIGLTSSYACAKDVNFDFTAAPVAKSVYSITAPSYGLPSPENKAWNSNSHFVVTDTGVLIFDTGSSELIAKGIRKAVEAVTDKPIRWVVNSHSHADHWLGNAEFASDNVEIIASNQTMATMKKYGEQDIEFFYRVTKGATGETSIAYPTSLLTHGKKRSLGGTDVEFIFSNDGHSPGDILLWLPEQKVILGGDVLSSEWMPILTPDTNIPNLISTLEAIAKLNPVVVLTGHGKTTTKSSILRDVNLLTNTWSLVKQGYKAGNTPEQILLQLDSALSKQYKPLYKDFDSSLERYVKLMHKMLS